MFSLLPGILRLPAYALTCVLILACGSDDDEGGILLQDPIWIDVAGMLAGPNSFYELTFQIAAVGDINEDGINDLLAVEPRIGGFSSSIITMTWDGNNSIPTIAQVAHSCSRQGVIRLGDLNGDNHLDIVGQVINYYCNTPVVFVDGLFTSFGDGAGGFTAVTYLELGNTFEDIQIADVDGDGDQDIVAKFNNSVSFLENSGGGAFLPKVDNYPVDEALYFPPWPDQSTILSSWDSSGYYGNIADIDRDGNLDVVTVENVERQGMTVSLGNGSGGYLGREFYPFDSRVSAQASSLQVLINNFDRDPMPEIILVTKAWASPANVFIYHAL